MSRRIAALTLTLLLAAVAALASRASAEPPAAPAAAEPPAPAAPPPPPATHSAVDDLERFQVELFRTAAPSVVLIKAGRKLGSGFFITEGGLILTNRHVVGSERDVKVVRYDGVELRGHVVEHADRSLDLAVVKVDVPSVRPLRLAPMSTLRVGSWVAAIGHGEGGGWTFTTGMISNLYAIDHEDPVIQTQIPINPGNSGGPVLDKEGRVIAIVTAYIEGANNVNFAIRVDAAFKHLKSLAEACDDCLVVRTRVDAPVFVDDALVGKGPRVLLVVTPGHHHVRTQIGSREEAKDVDFPADRDVDFATGVGDATVGASRSERAEQVSVLELPRDLTECEKILPYWIGRSVTVTLADGTSVTGELIEARGIERLGLALPNGERRRIALYDVQRVKRDR